MLFDLRGRRRRRTVQAVYLTLAVLMGGGLVLFGIGGNTNGGLFDAITGNGSSSGNQVSDRLKRAEERTQKNPADSAAWAEVVKLRFQDATAGSGYDQASGTFTEDGKKELQGVLQAWDRYVATKPAKVDPNVALLAVQAFGPAGLGQNDKAVSAMERVIEARPDELGLYVQYAQLAYVAGQSRKGDLAAEKAVELAPKEQKKAIRDTLDSAKSGTSGAAGTTTAG